MRAIAVFAISIGALLSMKAAALSLAPPPLPQTAGEVAAHGMLIKGEVIQGYDARKRQPEIIRAQQIFVGEGEPRDFVIHHSPSDYENELKAPDPRVVTIDFKPIRYQAGHRFDRVVLMPAKGSNGETLKDAWTIHFWGDTVAWDGKGFDLLVQEAIRLGRFRAMPPKQ